MPAYNYKARRLDGKIETGTQESPNQDTLVGILQQRGLIVLSVSVKKETAVISRTSYKARMHLKISNKDMILFTTQLAATLKANIPLLKCLEIQIQQTTSRKFRAILEDIADNVRQGHSMRESLAKHPRIFSSVWLNLVEIGEASGQLPVILEHLGEYLTFAADLRRKTLTALIYPSILVSVSIFAIYIFSVWIIPIFAAIFKDFKMSLPLATRIVIVASDFLRHNILLTVIVFGFAIFAFFRCIKTEKGKRIFDAFIFRIPIFGNFILSSLIEKVSSSLGILLRSGIPILQSLDIVARTTSNIVIETTLKNAYAEVRDGKPLSSALTKSEIMPPLVVSMCSVGEETGELDKMLEHVTRYYRDEVNVFVERLAATLEPLVIIIMGGIVFVLVLAMYLPIFQIALMGGVGR